MVQAVTVSNQFQDGTTKSQLSATPE